MEQAKVAVVTGAGSGIGRAVCEALIGADYSVVAAGRRREPLEETLAAARPRQGLCQPCDVTDEDSVRELFAAAVAKFGRVDLLFNNAGSFGAPAPIDDYPFGAWEEVMGVNLDGAFLCAREAFRVMTTQDPAGGRIVNNGSLSAQVPRPEAVAYTASKHAITGLTKALALEGRSRGIGCGQIDIGNAATELTEQFGTGTRQADGSLAPESTFSVDEVGRAVLYMASLPPEANVLSLTVMATAMPFVGRG